jgi:hypothetical protein
MGLVAAKVLLAPELQEYQVTGQGAPVAAAGPWQTGKLDCF